MNEFQCDQCGEVTESEDKPAECKHCGHDGLAQSCPMCFSIIDADTKVCPKCLEPVA